MKMTQPPPFDADAAARAVIQVGAGRGFVMETKYRIPQEYRRAHNLRAFVTGRIVVTAAHCLPSLPEPDLGLSGYERSYNVLGPLRTSDPSITTQCLFADPVADIAVLGKPDDQDDTEEIGRAFDELTENAEVLPISNAPHEMTIAWLLSLDGHWQPCKLEVFTSPASTGIHHTSLHISEGVIAPGMSGSPILLDDGSAISVISIASGKNESLLTEIGPQPLLIDCLPAALVSQLRVRRSKRLKRPM